MAIKAGQTATVADFQKAFSALSPSQQANFSATTPSTSIGGTTLNYSNGSYSSGGTPPTTPTTSTIAPPQNTPTSPISSGHSTAVQQPTTTQQNQATIVNQSTSPIMGNPSIQNNSPQSPVISSQAPADQVGQKYIQGFSQAQAQGIPAPQTGGEGRALVSNSTQSYQAPQQPYQPTPQFMQFGDPIMNTFVNAAMAYQQEAIDTGYTAKRLQTSFASSIRGIDLEAANIQNIMNGTRDDIRAEIGKAGGVATESQVEGLVTTRNRDLLKQYNNIELQKQTMENQMQLQVGLAQSDHQYAVDKFNNILQTTNLYKGIYNNATDQIDKLVQNVGYQGLAQAYENDPYALSLAEQHLNMPQGTLSNPQAMASLETYRQQSLKNQGQRLAIYVGNNTPNQGAINSEVESYKVTGIIPPLKNVAQSNAFWNAVGQDQSIIGDAQASKAILAAGKKSLGTQQTQLDATKTSINTVDKQLDLVLSNLHKVDRSGVPLINRYKNFIAGNYSGDKDVTALNNSIQTASAEFAKILSGSSASIAGSTVDAQHSAAALINSAMNSGQLETVINQMKKEGQFRLSSQKGVIDDITQRLRSMGGNNNSTQSNTVKMTGPKGTFNVPADQVDLFKQNGYK